MIKALKLRLSGSLRSPKIRFITKLTIAEFVNLAANTDSLNLRPNVHLEKEADCEVGRHLVVHSIAGFDSFCFAIKYTQNSKSYLIVIARAIVYFILT